MNASGDINVTDAHLDLRKAVGLAVGDRCSIGTGTMVFWIEETREMGAFQIDVDYSSTGGTFLGLGSGVACQTRLDPRGGILFAYNDSDEREVLTAAFVTLQSLGGQVDLFSCVFEMPEDRAGAHFAISVVDAVDPDGNPLEPKPLVGYRLE